jgi:beta-glucosidase
LHISGEAICSLAHRADRRTAEERHEEVPRDWRPHVDEAGNACDVGFGRDWDGVIDDRRAATYCGDVG